MMRSLLCLALALLLLPSAFAQDTRPTSQPTSQPTKLPGNRNWGLAKPIEVTADYDVHGAKLAGLHYASLDDLAAHAEKWDGKKVQIRGRIDSVCPKKGCWMMVHQGGQEVRVKFVDYGFFMPFDSAGRDVAAEGTVQFKLVTEAERRHYAEDAGKSPEEIQKIQGDERSLGFLAEAVQIGKLPPLPGQGAADPAVAGIMKYIEREEVDITDRDWRTNLTAPPKSTFTAGKKYYWILETNKGTMKIRLMPDVAPQHVTNTIFLVKMGFYDGLSFHRVIPGFMAQGGCPQGNGRGDPGFRYAGEFSDSAKHDRAGLLSMANAGPHTDGSQFFITFIPTPFLDGKHTIFGEVVEGMDTLKALEAAGSRSGATREPLKMVKSTIVVE